MILGKQKGKKTYEKTLINIFVFTTIINPLALVSFINILCKNICFHQL